jgi:hypothetical protein
MPDMVSTPLNDRFGIPLITSEAATQGVYMGSKYGYQAGAAQPITVQDVFDPSQDIWGAYAALGEQENALLNRIMNAKRPYGWNEEEKKGVWSDGIMMSNYIVRKTGQRVSPLEALAKQYLGDNGAPGVGGGKDGKGGRYSGPVTQTRLTDPMTAEGLLNNSLRTYLGRAATNKEKSEFVRALNRYEMENPTVTTPMGQAATVTTGGAQPTQFAEQFAQAQEGAAEYAAATTYLDAFLGALRNPVG